jgi:hypothetical protein
MLPQQGRSEALELLFEPFHRAKISVNGQSAFGDTPGGRNPAIEEWLVVVMSMGLQISVIYLPFLQPFGTVPLSLTDAVVCITIDNTVLWLRELWKLMQRRHVFLGCAAF